MTTAIIASIRLCQDTPQLAAGSVIYLLDTSDAFPYILMAI